MVPSPRCSEAIYFTFSTSPNFIPFILSSLNLHPRPPILLSPDLPTPSALRRPVTLSAIARDLGYLRRLQLPRAPTCRRGKSLQ